MMLSLVACTAQAGRPAPAVSGTGSAAPTLTATATPAATETPEPDVTFTPPPKPVAPDTLDDPTAEGAFSAIRYFYDLYPYAYATGDIEGLKDVSGNACGYCMKLMDRIEKLHADGGVASGNAIEIVNAEYVAATATPFHFEFQVEFRQGPGQLQRSTDGTVEERDAIDAHLHISLHLEEVWEFSKVMNVRSDKD